jgi:hypothetical protein
MFDIKDIIREAKEQGWRVEETIDGWVFYPADKSKHSILWHKTPSDWRAPRNFKALMRRAGFKWPGQK